MVPLPQAMPALTGAGIGLLSGLTGTGGGGEPKVMLTCAEAGAKGAVAIDTAPNVAAATRVVRAIRLNMRSPFCAT